jgi:phage-related protein
MKHTRPLLWLASSRKDYGEFPLAVQEQFGFELFIAQSGLHPPSAKPLKGLGNGVVELIEDHDGDTFRAIYTVRFETAVYVLHCFKKKSKSGIKTPQNEIELVKSRLKAAAEHFASQSKPRDKND